MKYTFKFIIILQLLIIISCSLKAEDSFLKEAYKESPLKNKDSNSLIYLLQNKFHDIYQEYKDSVVFISTEKIAPARYVHPFMNDPFFKNFLKQPKYKNKRRLRGLGTGFIISSDGYICTNHHVIAKMDSIIVKIDNKKYRTQIIGSDPMTDIALLKITGKKKFKPVHFGNSDRVKIGDLSMAIGNPFGLDKTYTFGIISAIGRTHVDPMGNSHIQTDASINKGNSGGPLINIDGEVIGVNRAIFSKSGGSIGLGFAISINTAKKTLVKLKRYGKIKYGYIGIKTARIKRRVLKRLGLNQRSGIYVSNLLRNGPSHNAGIKLKDIILEINNIKIKSRIDYYKIIWNSKAGDIVDIIVWRNKNRISIKVKVIEK